MSGRQSEYVFLLQNSDESGMVAEGSSDPIMNKVEEVGRLPVGWNYGEGGPAHPRVIEKAKEFYRLCKLSDVEAEVDVFPSPDESIVIAFYRDDICVEVTINVDGSFDVLVEKGKGFDYDELEAHYEIGESRALRLVFRYTKEEAWKSLSASYTQGFMTVDESGFQAAYLSFPRVGPESPFSIYSAPRNQVKEYATT